MYCEHCGKKIPDEAVFCHYCGQKVVILQEESIDEGGVVRVPRDPNEPIKSEVPMPPDSGGWYYMFNDEKRGPYKKNQLMSLLGDGKIHPSTMVWRSGMMDWRKVKDTELYTGTSVYDPEAWSIKCIIVAICAALMGIMLFLKWFDFYIIKVSIIEVLKIEEGDATFGIVLTALAAMVNLLLCIATVIQATTKKESSMGAGVGAIITFVCTLIATLFEEGSRLTFAPYMVLFLGITIIIMHKVIKE